MCFLFFQDIEQYFTVEARKEAEVVNVRLENIKLKNKLKKKEQQLKSKVIYQYKNIRQKKLSLSRLDSELFPTYTCKEKSVSSLKETKIKTGKKGVYLIPFLKNLE